jgi:adenylosuccinate synthase
VHPTALAIEAQRLEARGVPDPLARVTVASDAYVTTPFHQAACRIKELARGDARHGSCGVGVGEVMQDALDGHVVRVRDLAEADLSAKLEAIRERKRAELNDALRALPPSEAADRERRVFDDPDVGAAWIERVSAIASRLAIVDDGPAMRALLREGPVVFEGAQGVLLDEWRGFHPHTTWSTCTPANARALIGGEDVEVTTLGVLRTYATRHGAGPFPTEERSLAARLPDPYNVEGPWQGALRVGWLDAVLLRYALAVSGTIDGLALTHLDALGALGTWRMARAYRDMESLSPGPLQDLDHQAALTRALFAARPLYDELRAPSPEAVVDTLERALGLPVRITSVGPRASDVTLRGRLS